MCPHATLSPQFKTTVVPTHRRDGARLAQYTTMQCGGFAERVLTCSTVPELKTLVGACQSSGLQWMILGAGSNTLFLDRMYEGSVILNRIRHCDIVGGSLQHTHSTAVADTDMRPYGVGEPADQGAASIVRVGSGYSLAQLALTSSRKGWGGLEEFCGIPGTVGGAVRCNAGSHGRDISDAIQQVHFLDVDTLQEFSCPTHCLQWSYRNLNAPGVITGVTVGLHVDRQAPDRVKTYLSRRHQTQPVHQASAGCIFRNPPSGPSAGALLEMSGLKGHTIGGASVSMQHANFLVNLRKSATPTDVMKLIDFSRERVWRDHAIMLDLEVRIVQNGERMI
eukprot:jgi/Ulvmu1/2691/UM014_0147.1